MRRLLLRSGVLALALLAFPVGAARAASATPSPAGEVRIRHIDASAWPTVAVTVAVPPSVDGSALRITENGRRVTILNARPLLETGRSLDVVLALDTSNSVGGAPLAEAVAAAEDFVRGLPPGVKVGLVTFSDVARVGSPLTGDHAAVLAALAALTQTQAGTKLYDGVLQAAGLFTGRTQHNLILLTDGTDVGSGATQDEAISALVDHGVTAYTVGLEGANQHFPVLEQMAQATHGTFALASQADLHALYAAFAASLSHQYLVLYTSPGAAGAQVTIAVDSSAGSDSSVVVFPKPPITDAPGHALIDWSSPWILLGVLALSFLTVFLLAGILGASSARSRRDRNLAERMAARPAETDPEPTTRRSDGPAAWIPGTFVQLGSAVSEVGGFQSSLSSTLERAGLPVTPGEVVGASIAFGLAGLLVVGLVTRNFVIGLGVGVVASLIPSWYVRSRMHRRIEALHQQLPDVLTILASSMRAGHSFQQALDSVAKELGDPAGPEFARVVAEIRLGRPFEEALNALGERVGTEEFRWAMLGVTIQREVGGNLAEILDTLAETVRERETVRRQVRVLSAEGRLSVKILIAVPFLIAGYMALVNYSYMRLLWTTPLGIGLLVGGAVLMAVGMVWARKAVRIDV